MPRHPPRALFRLVPNASSARADAVGIPRNRNGPPVRLDRCALHFLSLALLTSNQPPPSAGLAYGAKEIRTPDPLLAKQVLYQLSYGPCIVSGMGLGGLEPPTPALSERCSNQLSYKPPRNVRWICSAKARCFSLKGGNPAAPSDTATLLRLSPSQESRLRRWPPCGWPGGFGRSSLPWLDGRCVQGPGTYSPRRSDPRLLAIPASWSRVADSNPN